MDPLNTKNTKKVLTLAFENAATRETQIFHPWRYFIAEGETLNKINEIMSDVTTVEQNNIAFAKKIGAKQYNGSYGTEFDFNGEDMVTLTGQELVDYNLDGGKGHSPYQAKRILSIPDFVVSDGRTYGQFHPDIATKRGREIRDEMKSLEGISKPAARFARWVGASNVDVPQNPQYSGNRNSLSASVTKIGDKWIVAVPVEVIPDQYPSKEYSESWVSPPGSTPITIAEYFSRIEKNSLIQKTPKS